LELSLELLEDVFAGCSPVEGFSFLGKVCKRFHDVGESLDKSLVEVSET
jgi:hypothetical protein